MKDVGAHDDGFGNEFGDASKDVVVDAGMRVMSRVHLVLRHVVVWTIDVRIRQIDSVRGWNNEWKRKQVEDDDQQQQQQ